jgi:threonylcarbamoyladenosine tRNA methylthiotransferase MtaB
MMKQFYITTLGCKVNQYDGQLIREQLIKAGYRESVQVPNKPGGVIVINTCTVTGRADQKCRNMIKRLVRNKGSAKVLVTGCFVEGDIEQLKKIEGVDFLVRMKDRASIPKLLDCRKEVSELEAVSSFEGRTRAFLKVQDGCNEFCAYCKVPYVRGRSKSKLLHHIVDEAKMIIANGYKELVVTGIHLGSYGHDLRDVVTLDQVVEAVAAIHGKFRIRISSMEPMNVDPALIKRLSQIDKLCPHFHLPLQSGDDAVLKLMGRRYAYAEYRKIAGAVKEYFTDAAISTDIIVGFPGETEECFKNSLKAVAQVGFCKVHVFPFSARAGTKAAGLTDVVPVKEITRRAEELDSIAEEAAYECKRSLVGKIKEVLVEDKRNGTCLAGFTDNYQRVKFQGGDELKNQFVKVKLTEAKEDFILGTLTH